MASEGWITSLEEAQKEAVKTEKDILIDFTGSDWCVWCQRLKKEVFETPEFKQQAPKSFVLVEIDFPKKKLPEKEGNYNQALALKYDIQGYPTICLLDHEGRIYAKTGYQEGGGAKYMEHLHELMKIRDERDALIKKASTGKDEEKLKALDELVQLMDKNEVGFAYVDLQEQIVDLDKDNQSKLNGKYSANLYRHFYAKKMMEQDAALQAEYDKKIAIYWDNLKKHDPAEAKNIESQLKLKDILEQNFQKRDWPGAMKALETLSQDNPSGEVAQQIYYLMAAAQFELQQKEKSVEYLKKALDYMPDSQLGMRIRMILPMVEQEIQDAKNPKKEDEKKVDEKQDEKNIEEPGEEKTEQKVEDKTEAKPEEKK